MFLGVVGFAMIVIIVAALIRSKSNPVPLFVIVPVIAALICGFTPAQIFEFVKAGVGKTWSTAVLFIFSIVYFSMMGDMGLFDPMVNWLVKKAGSNIVMVTVATRRAATSSARAFPRCSSPSRLCCRSTRNFTCAPLCSSALSVLPCLS